MKCFLFLMVFLAGCAQAAPPEVPYRPKPNPAPAPAPAPARGNYAEISTDAQYNVFKEKHKNSNTCQYFSATWCGPCKQFAPIFKRVAERNKHVLFVKIDIDGCPNAAKMNSVSSIPTIIIRDERLVGGQDETAFNAVVLRNFPK